MKWFYNFMGLKDKIAKQEANRLVTKKTKPAPVKQFYTIMTKLQKLL